MTVSPRRSGARLLMAGAATVLLGASATLTSTLTAASANGTVAAGASASTTTTVTPFRAYDSRDDTAGRLAPGKTVLIDVLTDGAGTKVVPDNATSVFFNLTYVDATAAGFLSVSPGDITTFPTTSTVNFTSGTVGANASLVSLPASSHAQAGKVAVSCGGGGSVHFIIDIVGYTS